MTRRWRAADYPQFLANWNENFFGWNAANFGWGADNFQNILCVGGNKSITSKLIP